MFAITLLKFRLRGAWTSCSVARFVVLATIACVAARHAHGQASSCLPFDPGQTIAAGDTSSSARGLDATEYGDFYDYSGESAEAPQNPVTKLVAPKPADTSGPNPVAALHQKYIPAGWEAQPLSGRDKLILGARDLYSPITIASASVFAGYAQLTNGQPNYGTDSGAFGERVGASILRVSNQHFFADSLLSPLLHEDPRYYVQGSQHSFLHRVVYAATRPLITRTDSGRSTVNVALLAGYAGASAISYSYYPQINKNVHDTAATYGSTLEGAAIGFLASEFSAEIFRALHLAKKP